MKNRDEFLQSVWEKSERAIAEEKARKRRRRQAGGLAAAAACLALVIGITSGGGPAELFGDLLGGTSYDGAAVEMQDTEDEVMRSNEAVQHYDSAGTVPQDTCTDDGAENYVSTAATDGTAMPGMSYDGALITEDLNDEDLYGELRKQTEAAEKAQDSQPGSLMAYYCLPIGIEIECYGDPDGIAMYTGDEKEVLEYMQWFYSIPEDQVLTTEEFESLNEIPTGYYKFTMDVSPGADTEGVDVVYWLVGDIRLP